jgi:hypothetical protein
MQNQNNFGSMDDFPLSPPQPRAFTVREPICFTAPILEEQCTPHFLAIPTPWKIHCSNELALPDQE